MHSRHAAGVPRPSPRRHPAMWLGILAIGPHLPALQLSPNHQPRDTVRPGLSPVRHRGACASPKLKTLRRAKAPSLLIVVRHGSATPPQNGPGPQWRAHLCRPCLWDASGHIHHSATGTWISSCEAARRRQEPPFRHKRRWATSSAAAATAAAALQPPCAPPASRSAHRSWLVYLLQRRRWRILTSLPTRRAADRCGCVPAVRPGPPFPAKHRRWRLPALPLLAAAAPEGARRAAGGAGQPQAGAGGDQEGTRHRQAGKGGLAKGTGGGQAGAGGPAEGP